MSYNFSGSSSSSRERKPKTPRAKRNAGALSFKKRMCRLCADKLESVDYKDTKRLERFLTDRGKILSSRISGNCAKHQRQLAKAIKKARTMALLPFVAE